MNKNNSILLGMHKDILSLRNLEESTISTYTSYMAVYISWAEEQLPGRDLSSITWEEIRAYIRFLKDVKGLNPRTINVHISQLRDFYSYVLYKEWDRREVPLLHFDEHLPIVPTKEQVMAIIAAITNPKHKAEIVLLYSSGIRVSELCRIRCCDIHMKARNVYISKSKNRSDRYAVLADRALQDLLAYVRSSYKGATPSDWLFPGQKPGSHICTESVRRVFSKALRTAGMEDMGLNLHSLRHAFGLHLYESGTDLMAIKEAMGHKSLSSTMVYLTLGIGNGRSVTSPYDV